MVGVRWWTRTSSSTVRWGSEEPRTDTWVHPRGRARQVSPAPLKGLAEVVVPASALPVRELWFGKPARSLPTVPGV